MKWIFAFLFSLNAFAGFAPENNLRIPVGANLEGGLTEAQFNKVIDRVAGLYDKKIEAMGAKLDMVRNWESETVNAYASRDLHTGKVWSVAMYGGLARHALIDEDAFSVVVCHELGHHLGGYPKKSMPFQIERKWASNEGESDYFAGAKCLRKYFAGMDNESFLKEKTIPAVVKNSCEKNFITMDERLICMRSALAGMTVSKFLSALKKEKTPVDISKPSTKKVFKIDNDHPAAQCRLDTYFQGALCMRGADEDISNKDGNIGACTVKNGDKSGLRPRCWMTKI